MVDSGGTTKYTPPTSVVMSIFRTTIHLATRCGGDDNNTEASSRTDDVFSQYGRQVCTATNSDQGESGPDRGKERVVKTGEGGLRA